MIVCSDCAPVTLLSVLANHAIAVPLSPTFPAHELRYILDQSGSLVLLSSEKFQTKADEVLKEGMETTPINYKQEKIMLGKKDDYVTLEEPKSEKGGMMLYTSGTTNRPVSQICHSKYNHQQMNRKGFSCLNPS